MTVSISGNWSYNPKNYPDNEVPVTAITGSLTTYKYGWKTSYYQNTYDMKSDEPDDVEEVKPQLEKLLTELSEEIFVTLAPSKPDGMTVFNSEEVDTKKQPMFFGQPLGVQRYDSFKYPVFDRLTTQMLGISGDQRKYLYRKIDLIINLYAQNKNTSLHLI